MSNVVPFGIRARKVTDDSHSVIQKVINGEVVECVNVDALSPSQRAQFFSREEWRGTPERTGSGVPSD